MKKFIVCFLCVFHLSFITCFAQDDDDRKLVESFVVGTAQKIISILSPDYTVKQKQELLSALFYEIVDYDWMGKFVISKNWHSMSQSQKSTYLSTYKKYLCSLYVQKYTEYNNQNYKIKDVSEIANRQFIVTTEVMGNDTNQNMILSYRIKKFDDGSIKLIDIIAEGISLLSTQRADFRASIEKNGIDRFVKILGSKM